MKVKVKKLRVCPSGDWMTCPYAKLITKTFACDIFCTLESPETDCDDYMSEMENDDNE